MDTQTQNNIRGMRLPDFSQDESGDDLAFDPALERKRVADGTEEYLTELRRDWAKQNTGKNAFPEGVVRISSALREWMLSFERTDFYNHLAEEFGLQGVDRMGIARVAWDIVLKSEWSPSPELFQKHIAKVSVAPELAKRFAVEFIPRAKELASVAEARVDTASSHISIDGSVEQKKADTVSLPLIQALGKYEKLGGQQVTSSKIVVKGQNDPVRPTIFNWLRAYRDELGVGAHDAVARGQFLFHSLNGKGLSSDERDQVGMLLKSLDENMPLTIDAGRQEVLFQRQRTESREQKIPNTKYQIPNEERPLPMRTAGAPLIRSAERPMFASQEKNISRAVFELPHINQQITDSRQQITENSGRTVQERLPASGGERPLPMRTTAAPSQGRPSAFEQAKAIQEANRDARLSISNMNSETVELGKMETSREESRSAVAPLKSGTTAPNLVVPAPRVISFEPAKIDNFSFGIGSAGIAPSPRIAVTPPAGGVSAVREQKIENSGLTAPKAERPSFANGDNVSSLSFSTNHVMPAEKEELARIAVIPPVGGVSAVREERTEDRMSEIPNTKYQIPNVNRPLPIPTPVQKMPTAPAPVNRYRITPTGHRDEVVSDDTPSPHVVDLRS